MPPRATRKTAAAPAESKSSTSKQRAAVTKKAAAELSSSEVNGRMTRKPAATKAASTSKTAAAGAKTATTKAAATKKAAPKAPSKTPAKAPSKATATKASSAKTGAASKAATSKVVASKATVATSKTTATTKAAPAKKAATTTKRATATRKVSNPKKAAATKKVTGKRARVEDEVEEEKADNSEDDDAAEAEDDEDTRPVKRARTGRKEALSKKLTAQRATLLAPSTRYPNVKMGTFINKIPDLAYDIFVMGAGECSELGLGNKAYEGKLKPTNVKRPRLNHYLDREKVGVVQLATGGMHCAAITKDNKILTWGANDKGALGRDTTWNGGMREIHAAADGNSDDDNDSDDEGDLNPLESTPTAVSDEFFIPGSKFVQVVASDSATYVLTADGRVYGWGNFRDESGEIGFEPNNYESQLTPKLMTDLTKIVKLAAGENHVLALDNTGKVWAWGDGSVAQLARRIVERSKRNSLKPASIGIKNVVDIWTGSNHSFALDKSGQLWAWGANGSAQCGVFSGAQSYNASLVKPTKVKLLPDGSAIRMVAGGSKHSVACTTDGRLITWGSKHNGVIGLSEEEMAKKPDSDFLLDPETQRRQVYAHVHECPEPTNVEHVSVGTAHSFALTKEHQVWFWGFNEQYQSGIAKGDDEIQTPVRITDPRLGTHQVMWTSCGAQFSVFGAIPRPDAGSDAAATDHATAPTPVPTDPPAGKASIDPAGSAGVASSAAPTSDAATAAAAAPDADVEMT